LRLRAASLARIAPRVLPFAAAIAYALIIAGPGVPALRHDWSWPSGRGDILDLLTRSMSGWDPRGIGGPNLYINDYAVAVVIALLVFVFGSQLGLFVFATGIGVACAVGAAALARRMRADAWGQAGVACIALFNPWVYAETVAGHTYMLLAYGALLGLTAECLRRSPRPVIASLLAVLTLQQLQFFLVAALLTLVTAAMKRRWRPLVSIAVAGAPVLAMVLFDYGSFRGVPYTLAWESAQSLAPANAAMLTGYYAGYTQSIDALDRWLMPLVALSAIAGFAMIARSRRGIVFLLGSVTVVVAAMGFRGPLEGLERFVFTDAPASRLFRELFDVLGFAAIGYCAGIGATARRAGAFVALALGCGLASAWIAWSPWRWWVPQSSLPDLPVTADAGTRYALLPAFQPLSTLPGRWGSGLDPDAKILPSDVDAINMLVPSYPVDAALSAFEQSGDARRLAELGVSEAIARPWLVSDDAASADGRRRQAAVHLDAAPRLSIASVPATCSVCSTIGNGAVFFGDVAGIRGPSIPAGWAGYARPVPIQPTPDGVRAEDGWVDARLAFPSRPDLGQAFGGAMTMSRSARLPVTGGHEVLAYVRGRLLTDGGAVVSTTTRSYAWAAVPARTTSLRCDGLCVVSLVAPAPIRAPAEAPARGPRVRVPIRYDTPWLAFAGLPPGDESMLWFDASFDGGWVAVTRGSVLPHVRIDTVVNGWLLPPRTVGGSVMLIHWPSATAAVFEAVGIGWIVALLGLWLRAFARRDDEPARETRA